MSLYLAVDAGGTKTDFLLADESREIARVRTGTIKRMRVDAETAAANLDQAIAELSATSGLSMSAVSCTCVGTAGETVPLVTDWLRKSIGERVGGSLILLGDVEIALDAAFPGQPGILILAGTGSNVAGRDRSGTISTAGGWGPALADQGSGHRIGHEALRAIFLAIDEGLTTSLLPAVLDFWQLESISQLIAFANQIPSPDFSKLTHLVLSAAIQGDPVAASVLGREGQQLAHLVKILIHRLRRSEAISTWLPQLAFAGSIMEKVGPVRHSLITSVAEEFPEITSVDGVVDPILGALWRARTGH
jgi:glucosamine kinase